MSQWPSPSESTYAASPAQRSVSQPVAVGVEQPVVGLPVAVEVDHRSARVLNPVQAEPPQLPRPVDADRPGAASRRR